MSLISRRLVLQGMVVIFGAVVSCWALLLGAGAPVSAHEGASRTIFDLPACSVLLTVCAAPTESDTVIRSGYCVDGLGGVRRCDAVAPFSYLEWDKSGEQIFVAPTVDKVGPAACRNGSAAHFGCLGVDLLSLLPRMDMGDATLADLWGWTDPETGAEYALVGLYDGTAFVDVSTPEQPIYLGKLRSHKGTASQWRDLKVYRNHAFIVADAIRQHGVQIFDLTQLREVTDPPVEFSETAWYNGPSGKADPTTVVGSSHNIAINEESGYAYAVGSLSCRGGLHMIDIRVPTEPKFAGCYAGDGYTHDTHCVIYRGPDLAYNGREICFSANEDTMTIVDVTNKAQPTLLGRRGYPHWGYIHQGWLTEDQRYFISNDERDEEFFKHNTRTYIWDVSDLHRPLLIDSHTLDSTSIDHNLYIAGKYAFEANYTSGLRILQLTDLAAGQMHEAAYFDTYPQDDETDYRSAWTAYPYFASGTVIVSSIGEGLFILRPDLPPEMTVNVQDSLLAACGIEPVTTSVSLTARRGYQASVEFSVSDLPPEMTATFQPTTTVIAENGTLTNTLDVEWGAAATGLYSLTITAHAGTDEFALPVTLHRAEQPPATPTGLTPTNHSRIKGFTPVLAWKAANQGLVYVVEIASDKAFDNVVHTARLMDTSYTPPTMFLPDTIYYWRVRAENSCGASNPSTAFSFELQGSVFLPLVAR